MPQRYKQAVVTPLLKKVNADLVFKNYRPVSNLSFVSKVIEKVVSQQCNAYIESNNLDETLQSAYKKHHSTETALIKVCNDILLHMDSQKVVLLTLLDLSAAFDTVDHEILLYRLRHTFGISEDVLEWFRSYLIGRTQYVSLNGEKSNAVILDCCVPQGSILGPAKYSRYTKPLATLIRALKILFHGYADDTQLLMPIDPNHKNVQEEVVKELENSVATIGLWMKANKLKLNNDKTECMVIGLPQQRKKIIFDSVTFGNENIKIVNSVRNLGWMMDNNLDMSVHVNFVVKTCYFHIKSIGKIRKFLTLRATKSLVQATVISRLDYCNALFSGISDKLFVKLQRVQNAAARLITKLPRHSNVSTALKELHWLPVRQRVDFKILLLTYKCLNNQAPAYLKELLSPVQHDIQTRRKTQKHLHEPSYRLKTCGRRAFAANAPRLWNQLPKHIREAKSINIFKKALKTHFFKIHC